MQFTDLCFLLIFLPLLLLVYKITKFPYRNVVLVIFSLIFYACGSRRYLMLLCISLAIDTIAGCTLAKWKAMGKKKSVLRLVLVPAVVCHLGILWYYKYADFTAVNLGRLTSGTYTAMNILLPMGLSFYTFKAISYLSDAYSGKVPEAKPLRTLAYLSFFGQIQSGPIARYGEFRYAETADGKLFCGGVVHFISGFCRKILLADVLGRVAAEVFDLKDTSSMPLLWLGAVCYCLQLYHDFSGYSEMAAGICNMLGYECPVNFNYPYAAGSVSEFWRRWHITLGSWFRDYVYIPLGGSRSGRIKLYFSLFTVWFLTGLWHGAGWNYIAWGCGYFVLISFEKTVNWPAKLPKGELKIIYRIFTLLMVNFQWVMFRSTGFHQGFNRIRNMCVYNPDGGGGLERACFLLKDYSVFLAAAVLFATPAIAGLGELCTRKKSFRLLYDACYTAGLIGAFIIALSFVVSGQNNPFLYNGF